MIQPPSSPWRGLSAPATQVLETTSSRDSALLAEISSELWTLKDEGKLIQCQTRLKRCAGCRVECAARDMAEHEEGCLDVLVECEACFELVRRGSMVEHRGGCDRVERTGGWARSVVFSLFPPLLLFLLRLWFQEFG